MRARIWGVLNVAGVLLGLASAAQAQSFKLLAPNMGWFPADRPRDRKGSRSGRAAPCRADCFLEPFLFRGHKRFLIVDWSHSARLARRSPTAGFPRCPRKSP